MFEQSQTTCLAVFLLSALIASASANGLLSLKRVKSVAGNNDGYDRYLLATNWAGTMCKFNKCTHYALDEWFNIHGLWPTTSGQSPQNCAHVNFKQQNLAPSLKQTLFSYWNSYYHDNWEFLDHEITKHGSCWRPDFGDETVMDKQLAQIIQGYDSNDKFSAVNTFLALTISVAKLYDPYSALKKAGIVPDDSKTHKIDDILRVFANLHDMRDTVLPICLAEKSLGKLYLAELRFCTDLNFKPTKCSEGELIRQLKRCRTNELIYPTFPRP